LEFKSKRLIKNRSQDKIIEYFLEIAKKYYHFNHKFIIIGIEDKDKIDGIDGKFIKSSLIGSIQEKLSIFLNPCEKRAHVQHIMLKKIDL